MYERGKPLTVAEMKTLVDKLFACETPFTSPSGHKTFVHYDLEDIKNNLNSSNGSIDRCG